MLKIELLTTGDELLEGVISDTNATYIARELQQLGVTAQRINTVGDSLKELSSTLLEISQRADLCIMTGGLGPTSDDLTLDALALSAGVPLEESESLWAEIQAFYRGLGREAPLTNRRQARVPRGGTPLKSEVGTAPGMRLQVGDCLVFAYPGVPSELKWHLNQSLIPYLQGRLGLTLHRRQLRVGLLGESALQELINTLSAEQSVVEGLKVGYQALGAEVRLKLSAPSSEQLDHFLSHLKPHLGEHLISERDNALQEELLAELMARGLTLSCAESCTAGGVSALLSATPGASAALMGGIVAYSNDVKRALLGVQESTLEAHGAVSEACALEMARGARSALKTSYALAVTGVAGPGGGSPHKPVGTVWFAWSGPHGEVAELKRFSGDRARIQRSATYYALFGLLRLMRGEAQ